MKARSFITLVILGMTLGSTVPLSAMNMLSRNDPYPFYSSADPYGFMTIWERQQPRDDEQYGEQETFRFAASYFRQTAIVGSNFCGEREQPLGDLRGRWNFIGLLYSDPAMVTYLTEQLHLLDPITGTCNVDAQQAAECLTFIEDPINTDRNKEFGFVSVPIDYIKQGARFETEFHLPYNLGCLLQFGVAEIRQHIVKFDDKTCAALGTTCPIATCTACGNPNTTTNGNCCTNTFDCPCKKVVFKRLTGNIPEVAKALGVCVRDYHEIAPEDPRARLYWRKWYQFNLYEDGWPRGFIMPFVSFDIAAPLSKPVPACNLFALSNGNNGHWGIGGTAGFQIDFVETVQLGLDLCFTGYTAETYSNVPVPTNQLQAGIFARQATVTQHPGGTWSFGMNLNAYHFIDRLSFWVQYRILNHQPDCFTIRDVNRISTDSNPFNPPDILVNKMREESSFEVQVANIGFNYDVSRNIELGFFWQQPIKQRNAYRATTLMATINITY